MTALRPTAAEIIAHLGLQPHPEGGHFREMFRDSATDLAGRARSTAIYFLLSRGQRSHWHRVDAAEIWHYYTGDPLILRIAAGNDVRTIRLGPDVIGDEVPQAVVPVSAWQSAESTGDWTLVGCTVAPAFEFSGFELAPPGWQPG